MHYCCTKNVVNTFGVAALVYLLLFNHQNFVEQNPHWEIEWLKDREKALERTRQNRSSDSDEDDAKKKKKRKKSPLNMSGKEKKKKKRSKRRKKHSSDTSSSSSSSESSTDDEKNDKSKSIRVAMRNKIKAQLLTEDVESKWEVLGRLVEERKRKEATQAPPVEPKKNEEDHLITQWMCVKEPQDKDKLMIDNLKDRMKKKQDAEKAKFLEMEHQRKEKEKLEREQKEKEEAEARLREEQKRREQEEAMRLKEKDREQVRFFWGGELSFTLGTDISARRKTSTYSHVANNITRNIVVLSN